MSVPLEMSVQQLECLRSEGRSSFPLLRRLHSDEICQVVLPTLVSGIQKTFTNYFNIRFTFKFNISYIKYENQANRHPYVLVK